MMRSSFIVVISILALPARAAAQAEQDEVIYYHLDAIGSVRAITDAGGQVLERLDFLPFGELWPSSATSQQARQFTGQERDAAIALDYFGARYYVTFLGRFTRPDDNGFSDPSNPQTLALYAYVTNNPLRYNDPTGHVGECPPGSEAMFCTGTEGGIDWLWIWESLSRIRGVPAWVQRPPIVPRVPRNGVPGGFPSCRSRTIQGDVGSISVQQPWSGRVTWGVTMDRPIVGVLFVHESFRPSGARRRTFNISRPYVYPGTGGTTHGSRGSLHAGSEYTITGLAEYPPMVALGTLTCIVE